MIIPNVDVYNPGMAHALISLSKEMRMFQEYDFIITVVPYREAEIPIVRHR